MPEPSGPDEPTRINREEHRLGRFVLRAELGRGAFGRVYRAFDPSLRREVALKVFRDPGHDGAEDRFEREATIAARLRHPNVVRIFERGRAGSDRYIAMELVEGPTFEQAFPELDRGRRVEILAQVAAGVGAAHEAGIVHRDLKPSNVLLAPGGEAKVLDFGLARHEEGSRLTRSGTVMGTPAFMSPEQIGARLPEIGPPTDVWAIGAMLYEALCDRLPYEGESFAEIREAVLGSVPPRPGQVAPDVPPGLEAVCLRCLEPRIEDRYASAAEVAAELRRWLAGESVLARAPAGARPVGRRRVALAATAGAALVLATGFALAVRGARDEPAEGPAPADEGEAARKALDLWSRIASILAEAEIYLRSGDAARSRAKLDEGIAICREYLESDDLPHARYFLARFLAERGAAGEAVHELDRALEADPGLGEAKLLRGRLAVDLYEERAYAAMRLLCHGPSARRAGQPSWDELDAVDPELEGIRRRATEDLSAPSGRSSFFREADSIEGRADLARLQGRFEEARAMLRAVLEEEPIRVRSRIVLAILTFHAGDLPGALAEASRAIEASRGSARAHVVRAQLRQDEAERARDPSARQGAWLGSLADADRAIELGESGELVWCLRGDAHRALARRTGDRDMHEAAIADYSRAIEARPRSAWALGNRGYARADLGYVESMRGDDSRPLLGQAIDDLTAALDVAPDMAPAWDGRGIARQYLAEAEADRGRPWRPLLEEALADHDEASARDPAYATSEVNAVHALVRIARFEFAAREDPVPTLARALSRAGSAAARGPSLAEAVGAGAQVALLLGQVEAARGVDPTPRFRTATELAGRAIELDAGSLTAWSNRGMAWLNWAEWEAGRGRDGRDLYRKSIADYDRFLELRPDEVLMLVNRAGARFQLARAEAESGNDASADDRAAVADCDRAIALAPGDAQAHFLRGHARFALGDRTGARADWERTVRLDPSLLDALRPWLEQVGG